MDLKFEILGGSDTPHFKLTLRHKMSDTESSFVYLAWSTTATFSLRSQVNYPDVPLAESFTFSSFLRDVTFREISRYHADIEACMSWRMTPTVEPLIAFWLSDETLIGMNLKLSTFEWSTSSKAKFETWKILRETGTRLTLSLAGNKGLLND
jgi:hypothetical protein